MDGNEDPHEDFSLQNDRKVQGTLRACLRAERRGDLNIEALTVSMFSCDLMG